MFITLTATREPWEAYMLCGRLRAEGIPASVEHANHVSVRWDLSTGLGGVKVRVPEDSRERAWTIDQECRNGDYRAALADEFGDIDELRCPQCGGGRLSQRRPFLRAALAVTILGLSGAVLPPTGWVYLCRSCGQEFRRTLCPAATGTWLVLTAANLGVLGTALAVLWLVFATKLGLVLIATALIITARWAAKRATPSDDLP